VHEVAPAHLRGVVFGVYQSQLSIGSIVGASVDFGTHTLHSRRAYQIPLAIFFAAPTIQAIALLFFPETPRWLMTQRKEEQAEASLRKLRSADIDELDFQAELNEIRVSTREQLEQNKKALFLEQWKGTNLRRTLLCIGVVCFHAANGSLVCTLCVPPPLTSSRLILGQYLHGEHTSFSAESGPCSYTDDVLDLLSPDCRRFESVRILNHDHLHGTAWRPVQSVLHTSPGSSHNYDDRCHSLRASSIGSCHCMVGCSGECRVRQGGRSIHCLLCVLLHSVCAISMAYGRRVCQQCE
jgi:hypothetical protein